MSPAPSLKFDTRKIKIPHRNLLEKLIKQYKFGRNRQLAIWISPVEGLFKQYKLGSFRQVAICTLQPSFLKN